MKQQKHQQSTQNTHKNQTNTKYTPIYFANSRCFHFSFTVAFDLFHYNLVEPICFHECEHIFRFVYLQTISLAKAENFNANIRSHAYSVPISLSLALFLCVNSSGKMHTYTINSAKSVSSEKHNCNESKRRLKDRKREREKKESATKNRIFQQI